MVRELPSHQPERSVPQRNDGHLRQRDQLENLERLLLFSKGDRNENQTAHKGWLKCGLQTDNRRLNDIESNEVSK